MGVVPHPAAGVLSERCGRSLSLPGRDGCGVRVLTRPFHSEFYSFVRTDFIKCETMQKQRDGERSS